MTATVRRSILLFCITSLAALPVLVGGDVLASVAARHALADGAHPYFVPQHALLLYVLTPIVVASACLLLVGPGLQLALALGAGTSVPRWVLCAVALSIVVVSAAAAVAQSIIGRPLVDQAFVVVILLCSVASLAVPLARSARGWVAAWPLDERHAPWTLTSMVVVPVLLLVVLAPKFHWESFNGDGVHAFEAARLLLTRPLPFWPPEVGDLATFPGMTTVLFIFPLSWFIRLFGEVEAAARLPYLLYLTMLYAGVLALVEHQRVTSLGKAERGLIWLALIVYTVTMAYSATYSPYAADIALPAAQDTLFAACFLGFVLAFVRGEHTWIAAFIGLLYLGMPHALLVIGLWVTAIVLVQRPRPWRELAITTVATVGWMVAAVMSVQLLAAAGLPTPGTEHAASTLAGQLLEVQLTDWRRLAFLVFPSGILPALALLAWRRQDGLTRALTLVTAMYFLFFFFKARVALHYFVPAMILPLVVFWRLQFDASTARRRSVLLGATGAFAVAALVISMPRQITPMTADRLVGRALDDRIGEYARMEPDAHRRMSLLRQLFPSTSNPAVPDESYGGSSLAWLYYANPAAREPQREREVNYVLQSAADSPPAGMRLLGQENGAALYVRSDSVWALHRALRPPTPAGSVVYDIPRGYIFPAIPLPPGRRVVSITGVLRKLRRELGPGT